jgi:hypothetical protein
MPLARYFLFVGGVLLALLLAVDAFWPKLPAIVQAATDAPIIRIHSDRKWPERMVFDTDHPPVVAAPAGELPSDPPSVADVAPTPREAFAQMRAPDPPQRSGPTKQRQRSHAAAKRYPPPVRMVVRQPFGWFGRSFW